MAESVRSLQQKKQDIFYRLEHDLDLWVSSADLEGNPTLVPLSFWWDGKSVYIATVKTNPTAKNIIATGKVRVALGHTRDVVLMDTKAFMLEMDETKQCGNGFTTKCGWDPLKAKGHVFFRFELHHVQAWREENEHANRFLMKNGTWLV